MNDDKIKDIIRIVESDKVTADDFAEILNIVILSIKDIKDKIEKDASDSKGELKESIRNVSNSLFKIESGIKESIKNSEISNLDNVEMHFKECMKEISRIESLIPFVKDYSYLEAVIKAVEEKIPEIKEITGKEIVDRINGLPTDDDDYKIGKDHIKGLEEELRELKTLASKGGTGGRMSGGFKSNNATQFFPLTADGITKVFTVPKSKNAIVLQSDFPTVLMEGSGFTLNATRTQLTLTVTNAPSAGSQLLFQYTSVFNIL